MKLTNNHMALRNIFMKDLKIISGSITAVAICLIPFTDNQFDKENLLASIIVCLPTFLFASHITGKKNEE